MLFFILKDFEAKVVPMCSYFRKKSEARVLNKNVLDKNSVPIFFCLT